MNIKMTIGKMVVSECRQTRFSSSLSTFFFAFTNLDVDWNVGHSLSAGGPPSGWPAGSPLATLFPQESRTLRSNQLGRFFKEKL